MMKRATSLGSLARSKTSPKSVSRRSLWSVTTSAPQASASKMRLLTMPARVCVSMVAASTTCALAYAALSSSRGKKPRHASLSGGPPSCHPDPCRRSPCGIAASSICVRRGFSRSMGPPAPTYTAPNSRATDALGAITSGLAASITYFVGAELPNFSTRS